MLNLMRKNAGTWLIKILLGAIVLVFIFWGVGSFRNRGEGRVASVNGDPVMVEEYNQTYTRIIEQAKQRFGSHLNDEMIKMLQIKKQAIDQLVEKRLLLSEARRLHFQVNDEDLAESIRAIPAFQDNGVFDARRYKAVLEQNHLTPESFESLQRENILLERLRFFVIDSVKISDTEIEEWYQWKNAQIKIDYAIFDPSQITDIHLSDEEIQAYFDNHKNDYKTETKLKASYLLFTPENYVSHVTLSDSEINDYFESHPGEFDTPKTVEASHILIKTAPDASDEQLNIAKEKATMVMKQAKDGKDFSELAKQYSDDSSGKNGGHLGAFKRKDMVEPFAEKAFSMKPGEISEPVKTQFGWHIIKVDKVNEAVILTPEETKSKIAKILTDEKSRNQAYEAASALYNASLDADSLAKVAASLKLDIKTTEPFTRKGPSGIKNPSKFASAAFDLSPNAISDIVDLGDAYTILQVVETIPESIPELSSVVDKVRVDLTKVKQDLLAQQNAKQLLSDLKNGKTFKDIKEGKGIKTGSTNFFKRSDRIPDVGSEREISSTAFGLSADNRYPADPVKGQKGYFVIVFKEKKAADPSELSSSDKDQITDTLTKEKQQHTFENMLTVLRNRSKVVIENGYL